MTDGSLTKAAIIEEVAHAAGLTKKRAEIIVDAVLGSIVKTLHRGEKVELRGLGSFRLRGGTRPSVKLPHGFRGDFEPASRPCYAEATAARVRRSLALAVLLAVTDEVTAERFYQEFKRDVLSPIEADHWMLDAGDVRRWLELAAETDAVVRMAVNET